MFLFLLRIWKLILSKLDIAASSQGNIQRTCSAVSLHKVIVSSSQFKVQRAISSVRVNKVGISSFESSYQLKVKPAVSFVQVSKIGVSVSHANAQSDFFLPQSRFNGQFLLFKEIRIVLLILTSTFNMIKLILACPVSMWKAMLDSITYLLFQWLLWK